MSIIFVNVWRKNIFDIYVTEYGTALTTILPILFLYLNTVTVTAGTFENRHKIPCFVKLTLEPLYNKGNNKITELRTILQRESPNSWLYKQTKDMRQLCRNEDLQKRSIHIY
jgi:hypothetical protein